MLAAVRPDDWNIELLIHIAGAMVLVGALLTALILAVSGSPSRLTFRALLWAAIPAWFVMRIFAEVIATSEGLTGKGKEEPTWVVIGYMTSEPAFIAMLIATIVAGVSSRRGGTTSKWVTGLIAFSIILSLVAVWAMTTKPS